VPRSGATFTREDAENVASKLKATREEGRRPHALAIVYHGKQRITQFGIRRGSRKDAGHGHLPKAVFLTSQQTRRLADCPLSYEEWVALMKEKNIIIEEEGE
jgi:hypothetical protein